MILLDLKQKTRLYHEKIERDLDILNTNMSVGRYASILQKFWGFYFPLEAQMSSVQEWYTYIADFEKRKKASLLVNDLKVTGMPDAVLQKLPVCTDLPEHGSIAQVLGCMYVLEGATLGGQIISRHIKEVLGFDDERGCTFFSSYGRNVGPMWKAFGNMVTAYSSTTDGETAIIHAACETFVKLDNWLVEGEQND